MSALPGLQRGIERHMHDDRAQKISGGLERARQGPDRGRAADGPGQGEHAGHAPHDRGRARVMRQLTDRG